MKFGLAVSASLLASIASAMPMQMLRDVATTTTTSTTVATVQFTTVIWVGKTQATAATATDPAPAPAPAATTPPAGPQVVAQHHKHRHTHTQAAPKAPAPAPEAPAAVPKAPQPKAPAAPAPQPKKPAPAPKPKAQAPAPAPAPAAPSGNTHVGDITYYTPGLGSCGITSTASEDVVALSYEIMTPLNGANPNTNPMCGKTITISYGGKTATAKIVDTCPGCTTDSIDLSPTVFGELAPLKEGRVSGVKWWVN